MLWLDGHYTLRLDHIRDEVATHVAQFDGLHQRPPRSCESSLGTLQCRADPSAAIARFAYCHDPPGLRRTFTCRADRLPLHSAPSWRPLRFSTRPNCPPRRHLSVLASVCCQKPQPHSLHSPPLPPTFEFVFWHSKRPLQRLVTRLFRVNRCAHPQTAIVVLCFDSFFGKFSSHFIAALARKCYEIEKWIS